MSSSIDLYTFSQMQNAICTSITSESGIYKKEYLLDNNPDTYWTPTSTGNQNIAIDLGEALGVYAICLFVRNYKTFTGGINRYWSDNGSDWTYIDGSVSITGTLNPLRMSDISGGLTHRYWLISIMNQNKAVKLGAIWLATKYTLSVGNEWPENDEEIFANQAIETAGGRQYVSAINKNYYKSMQRSYKINSSTQFGYLRSAYRDCGGRRTPLIINEGDSYDDAYLVRFADDRFAKNETAYQFYNPQVTFLQLPYIDDGQTY